MMSPVRSLSVVTLTAVLLACPTPGPGGSTTSSGSSGHTTAPDASTVTDAGRPDAMAPPDAGRIRPDGGAGCGTEEVCDDGLDNDCDGVVDDGCACTVGVRRACYDGEPDHADIGVCTLGEMECVQGAQGPQWGPCVGAGYPQPVRCGAGLDFTCTGTIDEGCPCTMGTARPCYTGPNSTKDVGLCRAGIQRCEVTDDGTRFGACMTQVLPQPERCDGLDYDCDGVVNTGCNCVLGTREPCYSGPENTERVGLCVGGERECVFDGGTSVFSECTSQVVPAEEQCDGRDHDCDGLPNTGCECTVGTQRNCYTGPNGTLGIGTCIGGTQQCERTDAGSGWSTCDGEVIPSVNVCDGVDRACNGLPTTGCPCEAGTTQPCYTGPAGTDGVGPCHAGTQMCTAGADGGTWAGSCEGQVSPTEEICGNMIDEDCNGAADDGCAGAITCPGDQMVQAGMPVMLTAMSTFLQSITWTIASAPAGGAETAEWMPDPPMGPMVTFRAPIVGVYVLRATGVDRSGVGHSCTVNVGSISHGLRVELSWDGTGDVDLHLHNALPTRWFGGGDDCYFAYRATPWGAYLDTDNVTALGPENIRIDTPVPDYPYTIGIHNWARAAGRVATVRVFCGTTAGTTPNQTFISRPLLDDDFWKVATITFDAGGACTIETLDTYVSDSHAQNGF